MKPRRKVAVLVGDGMGDYPLDELGGRTPLQAAHIPHIRRIAAAGHTVMARTVPEGAQPGSDVANLSLLGYDPSANYTGRAPIEAAGAGIAMGPNDVAFRCNLVTIEEGRMADYSAGHITTEEAGELLDTLREAMGATNLRLHRGVSYRHLLIWPDGPADLTTQPPHDIADQVVDPYLPKGAGIDAVRRFMAFSQQVFAEHPVNARRISKGLRPATQCWLWGQGRAMALPSYGDLFGLGGGVVSAVDLIRGLGRLAGLDAEPVPGATGYLDTNYEGKVARALSILERDDFVFVHLEAPDECSHQGLLKEKIEAIEAFDRRIVAPIWSRLESQGQPYRIILCTDHRTPVRLKAHTGEAVPMAWADGPRGPADAEQAFDEDLDTPAVPADAQMRELLSTAS